MTNHQKPEPFGSVRPRRAIDDLAYPRELEQAEAAQVTERRRKAKATGMHAAPGTLPPDAVGFGLSGGGIRSATFSLGVFQALARAGNLNRIDFMSTVSGGGYFGSFLGRLFTRPWVADGSDVNRVLLAQEAPPASPPGSTAWAARIFRWLRDNGRYLAPRGSGDVLLLGGLLLRNWIAIQIVLVVTMLTAFAALQIGRIELERLLVWGVSVVDVPTRLVCSMPFGNWLLWWSPWIVTPIIPLALIAAPAAWAYWLVSRKADGVRGMSATAGAVLMLVIAVAGVVHYGFEPGTGVERHPLRQAVCIVAAGFAALALLFYLVGEAWVRWIGPQEGETLAESGNRLRTALTRWLKTGLLAAGLLFAAALIDTVGGTIYALNDASHLTRWAVAVAGAFGAIGAFARPLLVLLQPTSPSKRPGISFSMMSWSAAIVVMAVWLVSIDVASHALRWGFHHAAGSPAGLAAATPTPVFGADKLVIAGTDPERTITARMNEPSPCPLTPGAYLSFPSFPPFLLASTLVLAVFTWIFGQTRRFANLSSVHGFYTARLTRTFLGATNEERLEKQSSAVSDTVRGDDCGGDAYWNWPTPKSTVATSAKPDTMAQPWEKGGPLHLLNTTVNETVDARSGIQNQDRKGIGLAVGPSGLSLGIRHHLVTCSPEWKVFPSDAHAHHVFSADAENPPEALSLGRWMSISGAAFSAAAGANTTMSLAILCGMFNVRLGYWWNSGTGFDGRWFAQLLPVQSALFDEMFATTHGTAGRLWNISDGGHFENMGGYELIRRRLPVIVIVDGEADPDYTFQGLSEFVRKARLDFSAEIVFLTAFELDGLAPGGKPTDGPAPLPADVRPYFGDLDSLRRGKWVSEELTNVHGKSTERFTLEPERTHPSKAHAALARVIYGEPDDPQAPRSWLVYVKATLTGDEPEDVCHYHRSHPDFPQETTLDQFFDEAQWESYRRLGQHVGHRVLTPELFEHLQSNGPQV
jgi:hypothetical protein